MKCECLKIKSFVIQSKFKNRFSKLHHYVMYWFGLLPFRSPLLRKFLLVSIPLGTQMFQFPRYTPRVKHEVIECCSMGFPHSEISGSKVVWHLPEAYRSQTTSFIASFSQGIHHVPLMELPVRSSTNTLCLCLVYQQCKPLYVVDTVLKLPASPVRPLQCSFGFIPYSLRIESK